MFIGSEPTLDTPITILTKSPQKEMMLESEVIINDRLLSSVNVISSEEELDSTEVGNESNSLILNSSGVLPPLHEIDDILATCAENNDTDQLEDKENFPIKQKGDRKQWKRSVAKENSNAGKAHESALGKLIQARAMRNKDCKCKQKCHMKISTSERQNLFQQYWSKGSYERRCDFIIHHTCEKENSGICQCAQLKRTVRRHYFLSVNGDRIRVCQEFFLDTLGISDKTVSNTWKKYREKSTPEFADKRGKHPPANKYPDNVMNFVHEHIKSFPQVESHYCRKDSTKRYLSSDLTVATMHRLYKEQCRDKVITAVSYSTYDAVFNTYN